MMTPDAGISKKSWNRNLHGIVNNTLTSIGRMTYATTDAMAERCGNLRERTTEGNYEC